MMNDECGVMKGRRVLGVLNFICAMDHDKIDKMNLFGKVIDNIKSGWHEGKGHKYSRRCRYEEALSHYKKALKLSDNGEAADLLHCIARTYARMGKYESALSAAENSLNLFVDLKSSSPIIVKVVKRLYCFIDALKNKDEKLINDLIAIR